MSAEFKPETRKIENRMAMFGVSREKYEMEKFGFKKLGNVQDAMTSKVQKSLIGLNEQDRMIVKSLKKEREERSKSDVEYLVRYF